MAVALAELDTVVTRLDDLRERIRSQRKVVLRIQQRGLSAHMAEALLLNLTRLAEIQAEKMERLVRQPGSAPDMQPGRPRHSEASASPIASAATASKPGGGANTVGGRPPRFAART